MKLKTVEPANDGKHKLKATFVLDDGKTHIVLFGIQGSKSYIDGASREVRDAYRARHKRDIANTSPLTRGNLSYFITWGDSQDIRRNITDYRRRFVV
jgi:hypothetical protein